jgi:hypothetical protein
LQLFSRDLGGPGSYKINADWFYLDYRWRDWLGVRAGRVKIPFGLYNDIADIDAARVPVLLPQSVYPTQNRDFLLAQTGVEVYGYVDLDAAGTLDYRAYAGTIFLDIGDAVSSGALQLKHLWTRYIAGGRVLWETPVPRLRIGGTLQALQLDTQFLYAGPDADPTKPRFFELDLPVVLWVASAEYATDDLTLTAEYSRWHIRSRSSATAVVPNSSSESERAYVMVSYRVAPWLQPAAYYAVTFPNISNRSGRANQQHDVAATLRFDINPSWLLKLEGHYMKGTASLSASLNNGTPPAALPEDWTVFLVKSTAYF